ncbi:elongation factor 1-beta [archaeon]|nr:elongation factor 1-beta [archaeon]|tara:strand:- start:5745 stop:6023 length:279 start_codon:yes stop_codon:yes gene_type:complete
MAEVIITFKVMPDSPETDMEELEKTVKEKISKFAGKAEFKSNLEEIAFGLKAFNITFVMDENKGSTDSLESDITNLENVNSVEVTDIRRALG